MSAASSLPRTNRFSLKQILNYLPSSSTLELNLDISLSYDMRFPLIERLKLEF